MVAEAQNNCRALVLGGGGLTGIGWELGLIHGLHQSGIDLTQADLIVGTSAGSIVGAQITSGEDISTLVDKQLIPYGKSSAEQKKCYEPHQIAKNHRCILEDVGGDIQAARKRIALRSSTASQAERKAIIASRLTTKEWPEKPLWIVALDAESGLERVFTHDSDVPLIDALTASCAVPGVWPAVTIGQNQYVDGGIRSICNADLAVSYDSVLILSPLGYGHGDPLCGLVEKEIIALRSTGSRVMLISPDDDSLKAIGTNILDPSATAGTTKAAIRQGKNISADVDEFWNQLGGG